MTNPALPPKLYLPTSVPQQSGAETATEIELRRTADGRVVLVAYSSLDRLVECCGEHQPWVLVAAENLAAIHRAKPYDAIALDSPLPAELRHQAPA